MSNPDKPLPLKRSTILSDIDNIAFRHRPPLVCPRNSCRAVALQKKFCSYRRYNLHVSSCHLMHIYLFSFYFFQSTVCQAKNIYLDSDVFPNLLFLIRRGVRKLTVYNLNIFSTSSVNSWITPASKFFPLFLTLLPWIFSSILFLNIILSWLICT